MKVCILEPYASSAVATLTAQGFTISQSPEFLAEAEVLLVRSQTKVNDHFLAKAPNLKLVVSATSGFDHLDWRECLKKNITASFSPNANAHSTAELALLLMLSWCRQFPKALHNVRHHQWRKHLNRGHSLHGKTIGIVGLGRVGRKVAALAQAFGMKVFAYDPYVDENVFSETQSERLGLMELLKSCDFVSLHVPLTKETKHLINYPTLREMTPNTVLVNVSRGSVVDESEVLVALDENVIRGALLDVLEREPPVNDSRLLTHPKVILTPHIGAHTEEAWERASMEAAQKVIDFSQGKPLSDTLPLKDFWFEKYC